MARRRNTILEALERFRAGHVNISSLHFLAYLYICENEGLNVSELAQICDVSRPTASRVARTLASSFRRRDGERRGLIECRPNPEDCKGRVLYLTDVGRRLRRELDELIDDRRPIVLDRNPVGLSSAVNGRGHLPATQP